MLQLTEAARKAGISKSTLWRAIKAGRVSAQRQEDGTYLIDPAELARAYPPSVSRNAASDDAVKQVETASEQALKRENELLRGLVDDLRSERDRLLGVVEEQAKSVRLLTDQRTDTPRPSWWRRLRGRT